ncbi:MAG: DNA repair protein RadC [Clostridium sp.]|nr:DNA repair protein RadC [Clostridium sp.]
MPSGEKLSINQWAEEDRPREKFAAKGPSALSNAELLAILIGSGSTDESAVELMRRVLADCGNSLKTLGRMSLHDLAPDEQHPRPAHRYKGLGRAKAVKMLAACELGRRRMAEEAAERPQIGCSRDVYNFYLPLLQDCRHEEFHALLLNQANRVLTDVAVSKGGLTETVLDIRLLMREVLLQGATTMVVCHNHPSGNLRPSRQDDALTEKIEKACRLMNIRLIDHVILADGGYYSYCDEGKLGHA